MFSNEIIEKVWEAGLIIEGVSKDLIRKDACGAFIMKDHYGNHSSDFGWEIDLIVPEIIGGDASLENLRPLQWQNHDSKGNDYPVYFAVKKGQVSKNITVSRQLTVNAKLQKALNSKYGIENP